MQRPHIITISGKPGSGKSSTADQIAELLGYDRYSAGDLVRTQVREEGITLAKFNQRAEGDHSVDHAIDDKLRQLRDATDLVIDSRLGFYWIPESFKVYLELDIDVATARIFKDATTQSRLVETGASHTMNDVQKEVHARINAEIRRFNTLYGINPYDDSHFDLIINTARHSPQTVALIVLDQYKHWLQSDEWKPVHQSVPFDDNASST